MRLWPKHWHAETWICSLQGHVTPARWAVDISPEELPKPRRGEVLHDAIVMRLIAINKALHALAFTLIATALTLLRTRLSALKGFADRMLASVQDPLGQTGPGTSRTWLARHLESILKLRGSTLGLLLALAVLYAVIEWVEARSL